MSEHTKQALSVSEEMVEKAAARMCTRREELIAQPLARIWPELAKAALSVSSQWQDISTAPKDSFVERRKVKNGPSEFDEAHLNRLYKLPAPGGK